MENKKVNLTNFKYQRHLIWSGVSLFMKKHSALKRTIIGRKHPTARSR